MTPEATIKTAIREHLKKIGAYHFAPVQMGLGVATVDVLACVKGRFVGIEVKVPGKVPTPRQMIALSEIERAGGVAFWCTSLADCKEKLHEALT